MSINEGDETATEEAAGEENVEEEEVKPIKIFINNINTYQGFAILKPLAAVNTNLKSEQYIISGTFDDDDTLSKKTAVREHVTKIINPKDHYFEESVIDNDIIIYDIGLDTSQIDEAKRVLDALEKYCNKIKGDDSKRDIAKHFILLSTPLTWAKTEPIEEDSDILTEDHYRKRRNHPCYVKHKCLEQEVVNIQKRCKPHLRTVVVCPGFTYGEENEIFHYIFKLAYFGTDMIPLFKPGNNYVPMLYINDLGRMIKQLIDEFPRPTLRYILAVQNRLMKMRSFMRTIVFNLSGNLTKIELVKPNEVLKTYEEIIPANVFHAITIDIKMAPKYFEDFKFSFEDNFEDFGQILTNEYRVSRNLLPIKILVDGPPRVGKTTITKCLADFYKIHYIDTENAVHTVMNSLERDIEETEKVLQHIESEKAQAEGEAEDQEIADDFLDMEDRLRELLDVWHAELHELRDLFSYNQPDESIEKEIQNKRKWCLMRLLSSKACNENQGFVLDGFPFTYTEAEEIFPKTTATEGEELEEEEEKFTISTNIPKHVILLDASDELLCNRAMSLNETEAVETRSTEELFLKRLQDFRDRNEEDKSLLTFFYDNNIIPMTFCIAEHTKCEDVLDKIKMEIGPAHVYAETKAELEAYALWEKQMLEKQKMEERRIREEVLAAQREERERNLQKWTAEFERLKCKEQEMLEAKTLPLRQYLSKYVLPTLTDGLLRVAEVKPDDPIDFLAEYLFDTNPTGHILDPAYSDRVKRLLLDEGDEDVSKALKMTENQNDYAASCPVPATRTSRPESASSSSSSTKKQEVGESNLARLLLDEVRQIKSHVKNGQMDMNQ